MAGYTYTTFVTALAQEMVEDPTDADFLAILPTLIDQAEQRIYRDLDLLATYEADATDTVTTDTRTFTLPQTAGRFVVVDQINIFTPVDSTSTRNPVVPASLSFINMCWPSTVAASATTIPQFYAMLDDQTVIFGPPPGADFGIEVIGTIRPTPLSSTNTTTTLSLYLPDLFLAAAMVASAAYQKNYSAASDDPKQAISWESTYQQRLESANAEEERKKASAASWSPKRIEKTAMPQRG